MYLLRAVYSHIQTNSGVFNVSGDLRHLNNADFENYLQWRRSKDGEKLTCIHFKADWNETGGNAPLPRGLSALKFLALRVGPPKNVAHLMPQYQQDYKDYQDYERYG